MSSRGLSRAGRGQDAGDRRDFSDEAINPTKSNTRARSDSTRVFGHTAFISMYQSCISLNARATTTRRSIPNFRRGRISCVLIRAPALQSSDFLLCDWRARGC